MPTRSSWWHHIQQVCEANCPRKVPHRCEETFHRRRRVQRLRRRDITVMILPQVNLAWTVLEKFHPKQSEVAFSTAFSLNFRPEVDNDVTSCVVLDYVGMAHYVFVQHQISRLKQLNACKKLALRRRPTPVFWDKEDNKKAHQLVGQSKTRRHSSQATIVYYTFYH